MSYVDHHFGALAAQQIAEPISKYFWKLNSRTLDQGNCGCVIVDILSGYLKRLVYCTQTRNHKSLNYI